MTGKTENAFGLAFPLGKLGRGALQAGEALPWGFAQLSDDFDRSWVHTGKIVRAGDRVKVELGGEVQDRRSGLQDYSRLSCESSAGLTEIFFWGRAFGVVADGNSMLVSSLSSLARIVLARSMTEIGKPARRATWIP